MWNSKMLLTLLSLACLTTVLEYTFGFPTEKNAVGTANKGAFIPAFDEIVVESSLTVRGKSGSGQRQGKKLVVVPANEAITISTTSTTTESPSSSSTTTTANSTAT